MSAIETMARFVAESNRIEGIRRDPTKAEIVAGLRFIGLDQVTIEELEQFVQVCQPGAELRTRAGMDVFVGQHTPPPGGPAIALVLRDLLAKVNTNDGSPYELHRWYETLHPFMDGNGRSGRILWAWQMVHFSIRPGLRLGFLHCWYYQSLEASRAKV